MTIKSKIIELANSYSKTLQEKILTASLTIIIIFLKGLKAIKKHNYNRLQRSSLRILLASSIILLFIVIGLIGWFYCIIFVIFLKIKFFAEKKSNNFVSF